ncbi:conserved hypothetical protein [Talaromyces stipitatus ATCC 10500]|uniref:Phosphatidylserine decarboxylase n=1 Tax=Talaromyces stipitatus (strain ATCC 10500 / CBS 375.48 / QM 6759 / NRRL 1006) TaxID=441959 RepID=B8ML28_TALSN|nr:uncharacterized protein TSTA_048840 [Talaromyces stipitatus ATCC 10500]EED15444.1 conserved hypothetical protein [Talaromyces stipitatus ATCC 10500]
MTTQNYKPKSIVAHDLADFICRTKERTTQFEDAVSSPIDPKNGGDKEMKQENIHSLSDYIKFVDELVRWVPKVSSTGDELMNKLLVFYWVLDQLILEPYQTKIAPTTANTDLTWFSYWLVTFACEQGKWLDSPESAGSVYSFYRNENYSKTADEWEEPENGRKSFNHWFARRWKDINKSRPVASPGEDDVIVHVADSMFDGNTRRQRSGMASGDTSPGSGIDYKNGSFMHAFLGPTDYHRQHAPVSGKVIEVRSIQDQVYLQVSKKLEKSGIKGSRGLSYGPGRPRVSMVSDSWLDCHPEKYGKVAVLPIGMAQVSSVKMTVEVGDKVKKGDNISCFQFGGSDVCIVFERRVKWRLDLKPGETKLNVTWKESKIWRKEIVNQPRALSLTVCKAATTLRTGQPVVVTNLVKLSIMENLLTEIGYLCTDATNDCGVSMCLERARPPLKMLDDIIQDIRAAKLTHREKVKNVFKALSYDWKLSDASDLLRGNIDRLSLGLLVLQLPSWYSGKDLWARLWTNGLGDSSVQQSLTVMHTVPSSEGIWDLVTRRDIVGIRNEFIKRKYSVNTVDEYDRSLGLACRSGQSDFVRFLLDTGAVSQCVNDNGRYASRIEHLR